MRADRSRCLRDRANDSSWGRTHCCGWQIMRRCLCGRFAEERQKVVTFAVTIAVGGIVICIQRSVGSCRVPIACLVSLKQLRLECLLRSLVCWRARLVARRSRSGKNRHRCLWLAGLRLCPWLASWRRRGCRLLSLCVARRST